MAQGKLAAGLPALAGRLLATPAIARLSPARNLRVRLGLILSLAALAVALAITALVSITVERRVDATIGRSVGHLAEQIADRADQTLLARSREINLLSEAAEVRDPAVPTGQKRQLLQGVQASIPEYAWLGIVDAAGTVLVGTDGVLEGESAAERPWFSAGLQGRALHEAREEPPLAAQLPTDAADETPRFVAITALLANPGGEPWGILVGEIPIGVVRGVAGSVMASVADESRAEAFVVAPDGTTLVSPAGSRVPPNLAALDSIRAAQSDRRGYVVERWPDGASYITGFALSRGGAGSPGPGWTTLVRQSADASLAPARELQQQILILGFATALLLAAMGWYLAGRIVWPLAAITAAARRIERGERGASIPRPAGQDEIAVLAESLDSLVESLRTRERDLQRLAAMHEQRVRERTAELEQVNRQLELLSATDPLTGLANRGLFDRTLDREWRQLARSEEPLSLIMVDIDHFKGYNDTYGHQQGDECLRQVAGALFHTATRAGDLVARYGGEEFAVILSHMGAAEAMLVAEKLRRAVFELRIPHKANSAAPGVSISLGVATIIPPPTGNPADLIQMADRALYRAKSEGRDRAVQELYVPPAPQPDATISGETEMVSRPFQFRRRPRP